MTISLAHTAAGSPGPLLHGQQAKGPKTPRAPVRRPQPELRRLNHGRRDQCIWWVAWAGCQRGGSRLGTSPICGPGGNGRRPACALTIRDGLATLLVAAAAAVYIPWVTGAAMAGWPVRAMAAVVFALGFAACVTNQKQMVVVYRATREGPRALSAYAMLASGVGALALMSGAIALVTASAAMPATLAASIGQLWAIATARHTLASGNRRPSRRPEKTASAHH